MQKEMKEALMNGRSVRLSDLGCFRLTINAKGVPTLKEVTTDLIEKVNIRFLPSEQFRQDVNKSTFIPMESLYDKTEEEN